MANKKRFTEATEKQAVQMYENGESTASLAAFFKAGEATVLSVLKKHGVQLRKRTDLFIHPAQRLEMRAMYEAGHSVEEVAKAFDMSWRPAQRVLEEAGVTIRPAGFRRGEEHHAWSGGRHEAPDGYIRVWLSADHPFVSMAQKHGDTVGGYVLEHRLVMAEKLGRPLTDSETVHHKDTNRQNNHPDNLELRQGRHGKGGAFRCADCGSHNVIATSLAEKN